MPGHYPAINEKQIWDLVNFVLALPYEPELLTDAPPPARARRPPRRLESLLVASEYAPNCLR